MNGAMTLEALGHVDIRSGVLAAFDFGLLGAWAGNPPSSAARHALAQGRYQFDHEGVGVVAIPHLPPGRYPVTGIRLDGGEFAGLRQSVTVEFAPNAASLVARTLELGRVPVDSARIGLFDIEAVAHWNESVAVDGLADVVFWGLHENELAAHYRAPRLGDDGFGFANLPVAQAESFARELEAVRNGGQFRFAFDFRPHSHPYHLLAQIRRTPSEAGVLDVGGALACGFMTTWGDGEFPVLLDLDAHGRPVRCGLFFATNEAQQGIREVNGGSAD